MTTAKYLLENQQSERLHFRKLEESDFENWLTFCSDPASLQYIFFAQNTPADPSVRCRIWMDRIFNRYANNLGGLNVLIDKNTNEFIGQCGLLIQTVEGKEEMEIGYSIMPRHRKKGYALEAAKKCRDFAFENNFRDSIISIIHPDNSDSAKVALGNGMIKEREAVYSDNPVNIFRITKEEWLNTIGLQKQTMLNYFSQPSVPERYLKGRPDFHSNTIKHISDFLKLDYNVEKALDVACGTGLSSKALLAISNKVYATDVSQQMLDNALLKDQINYFVSPAEKQPFANESFDLITVCSAVHWFNIEQFLAETKRLLKNRGWLFIYDNFLSALEGNSAFKKWNDDVYRAKFISPPRNNKFEWTEENLRSKGFALVKTEEFVNPVSFSKSALIAYYTSQSNIISAVERNETTYEAAEYWLDNELSSFFKGEHAEELFYFDNWIKFLQKIN